ncbi:uncharacterized protein BDR25DRAFT_306247 [Lindgomyces ingoldianus]|uniref:Uncharacterized protein n=1 Tax=Lindgomyces ingoldianus TaxID=673940 RepID=A0ACB6QHJ7_9PLEO|nr:uncharacterized protein BDR25DRAFT_306247 [Lindgomyces ingoldianus]KAF2466474.1 hypothetical protein BDR25DRAFT_306247 [Lindgomyces ingoldianus]
MSGKEKEYVDVTKQVQENGGFVDTTTGRKLMLKEEDARVESNRAHQKEGTPPLVYSNIAIGALPPRPLAEDISANIRSLQIGDLTETISVPMILSTEKRSFKDVLKGRSGSVSQTVMVRKMTRDHYLKHYAKDSEGNYIGTERAAVDAGLVFVPSKSTPEEILQQVQKVASGKQHYIGDYGTAWSGVSSSAM